MNLRLLAAALRLAADALEAPDDGAACGPKPPAKRRRRAAAVRVVPLPALEEPMDEVAAMRQKKGREAAAAILRAQGVPVEVPK